MTTEEGIVISREGANARVRTQRTGACESCAAKSGCSTLGGGKEMEVEAINSAGALEGDRVIIAFETSSLMKASFLIYIFPILSMMLGGFTGQKIAPFFNVDPSAMSVIGAFLFLIIAFSLVRLSGNRLGKREHYKPKIIRILKDK